MPKKNLSPQATDDDTSGNSSNSSLDHGYDMRGKTAVVVGAESGIGRWTALELARYGARVILACSDAQAADDIAYNIRWDLDLGNGELGHRMVSWRHVDVASLESVRQFARKINEAESKVHLLVVVTGAFWPQQKKNRQMTPDGKFELTFAKNYLGPFLLTNSLLGLLKRSTPSRIVFVTSGGYKVYKDLSSFNIGDPQFSLKPESYKASMAYSQTALANIMFAQSLQRKLWNSGVSVFIANPGMVKTEVVKQHRLMSKADSLFCGPVLFCFGKTPQKGAKGVIYCCCEQQIQNIPGTYYSAFELKQLDAVATNDKVAALLWNLSENLTQEKANGSTTNSGQQHSSLSYIYEEEATPVACSEPVENNNKATNNC